MPGWRSTRCPGGGAVNRAIVDLLAVCEAVQSLPGRLASLESEVGALTAEVTAMRTQLASRLVSVVEAATAIGVSVPTVRRWVKSGSVPVVRIGHTVRVDLSKLT